MKLAIDNSLAQAILNYLAQRPYIEVKDLVAALLKLEKEQPVESVPPNYASPVSIAGGPK